MSGYDSVKARMRYRNKSIWKCLLCAACDECYNKITDHPNDKCRDFQGEGAEVTFERGKEWYLIDMHMLRYHEKEMSKVFRQKYVRETNMGIEP